ncbi:hypothetical protein SLS53_000036 [Cytospora paraplurivora]|uniref:C2H2-type domain-containing protein n=1 Tax=Cytospora paraplurivora TaxID=2898453 RepID=A0AAN9YL95_9PEZI
MLDDFRLYWDSQEVLDKQQKHTIARRPHWGPPPKSNWDRIYFTADGKIRAGRKAEDNWQISQPAVVKDAETPRTSMTMFADMTNTELRRASQEGAANKADEEVKSLSVQSTADSECDSKLRAQPEGSPAGPPEVIRLRPGDGSGYKKVLGIKRKRAGYDEGEAPIADQRGLSPAKVVHQEQASCGSEATVRLKGSPKKLCPCDQCGRGFGRREHLARHIKTVHEHGTEAQCGECLRKFSRYDNGIKHVVKCPTMGVCSNLIDLRKNVGVLATSARRPARPQPRGVAQQPGVDPAPEREKSSSGTTADEEMEDAEVDDRPRGKPYPGMIRFTPINRAL